MLLTALTNFGNLDWQCTERLANELNIEFNDFNHHLQHLAADCDIQVNTIEPVAAILEIKLQAFALFELTGISVIDKGLYVYTNALDSQYDNTQALDDCLQEIAGNISDYMT